MTALMMKYFVLKPAGDHAYAKASRVAMLAYAKWIDAENPELAKQLQDWAAQENAESYARSVDQNPQDDDGKDAGSSGAITYASELLTLESLTYNLEEAQGFLETARARASSLGLKMAAQGPS